VRKASADAAGTFQIDVETRTRSFLSNLRREKILFSAADATVQMGGVTPRLNR
jgi:hypothetical protein